MEHLYTDINTHTFYFIWIFIFVASQIRKMSACVFLQFLVVGLPVCWVQASIVLSSWVCPYCRPASVYLRRVLSCHGNNAISTWQQIWVFKLSTILVYILIILLSYNKLNETVQNYHINESPNEDHQYISSFENSSLFSVFRQLIAEICPWINQNYRLLCSLDK